MHIPILFSPPGPVIPLMLTPSTTVTLSPISLGVSGGIEPIRTSVYHIISGVVFLGLGHLETFEILREAS